MKPACWLLMTIFCAASFAQNRDEAAIREVVKKYVNARDAIDPHAIEALFTADADQLVSSGEWRKGRDELVRGTVASSKKETGTTRTITIETVRFLDANVAIADGRYDLGTRHMWSTFLFKKDGGVWKIAAIRNMLPAAQ